MTPHAPVTVHRVPVPTNGIELSVREAGAGPLVVLCHGFPQTSASWSHQIPALAEAGFHVLAPDMRGYGSSARPGDVTAYDADTIAADVVGLLDHAGERDAVFVGHDIGAAMVWHLARAHPDRVRAIVALSVPFAPRPPVPPTVALRRALGRDHYLLLFQEPEVPEEILSRDVRRTLLTEGGWTREWSAGSTTPGRPAWCSERELADAVAEFTRTGFAGGLAYYRNLDRNWELAARFGDQPIRRPALFVTGASDPVRSVVPAEPMRPWVTELTEAVVPDAGHFIHQQRPDDVNQLLVRFARKVGAAGTTSRPDAVAANVLADRAEPRTPAVER